MWVPLIKLKESVPVNGPAMVHPESPTLSSPATATTNSPLTVVVSDPPLQGGDMFTLVVAPFPVPSADGVPLTAKHSANAMEKLVPLLGVPTVTVSEPVSAPNPYQSAVSAGPVLS